MKVKFICIIILIFCLCLEYVEAKDLKASLSILPQHVEVDKDGNLSGGFVEITKAINDVYLQGNISINVYPFARSLMNIQSGKADFHLPMIKASNPKLISPYTYATECITKVAFVLYTRSDNSPLDLKNINRYVIDTQRGHKEFFPFNIMENGSIDQGIQKLLKGRIDGYIMEQDAVDNYIRENDINNIRRTLYREWDVCVVIPKGKRQYDINSIISNALRKLKKSGRLQKIIETIHQPYNDWQPYLVGK